MRYCPIHRCQCTSSCILYFEDFKCLIAEALKKFLNKEEEQIKDENQDIDINLVQLMLESYCSAKPSLEGNIVGQGEYYIPESEYYNLQGGR